MAELDPEDKTLITPATTPGSIDGAHVALIVEPKKCCSSTIDEKKDKWYLGLKVPTAVIIISLFQVIIFFVTNDSLRSRLRFEPGKQSQAWRLVTYMLLHDSWQHLSLNVMLQCLFAIFLESTQGFWRVLSVYIGGGIGGAMGAACLRPDLLVGSSAGVYALLLSYLSYFILNFQRMKYRLWKCISFVLLVASDVLYNIYHYYTRDTPTISWGAHFFGALVGFVTGLAIYTSNYENKTVHKAIMYTALVLQLALFIALAVANGHLRKCNGSTVEGGQRIKYSSFCY